MITEIGRLGIAVKALDEAVAYYENTLGLVFKGREEVESQKVRTAFFAAGDVHIEKRHEKGALTARERLAVFFDGGNFIEVGMHAHHSCINFGLEKRKMPGDGVICATGVVDGRQVAAFTQDFTVGGGSVVRIHAKKIQLGEIRPPIRPHLTLNLLEQQPWNTSASPLKEKLTTSSSRILATRKPALPQPQPDPPRHLTQRPRPPQLR